MKGWVWMLPLSLGSCVLSVADLDDTAGDPAGAGGGDSGDASSNSGGTGGGVFEDGSSNADTGSASGGSAAMADADVEAGPRTIIDDYVGYWTFEDTPPQILDRGPNKWHGTLSTEAALDPLSKFGMAYFYGGSFGANVVNDNPEFELDLAAWQLEKGGGEATVSFPMLEGSKVLRFDGLVSGGGNSPVLRTYLTVQPNTSYAFRVAAKCDSTKPLYLRMVAFNQSLTLATEKLDCLPGSWQAQTARFTNGPSAASIWAGVDIGADTVAGQLDHASVFVENPSLPRPMVDLGTAPTVAGGTGLSICAWTNFRQGAGRADDGVILGRASGPLLSQRYWSLAARDMRHWQFSLKTQGVTTSIQATNVTLSAETWTHVCATYDGTQARIYQNGQQIVAEAVSGPIEEDPSVSVAIGNHLAAYYKDLFPGKIDEVRLYDRALSAAEVKQVHDYVGP